MQQPRSIQAIVARPESKPQPAQLSRAKLPSGGPSISCMMPTRGHLFPARHAIRCFLRQSYADRELVVVCGSADSEVKAHLAELNDPRIHFQETPAAKTVGDLRNAALTHCSGDYICIWDDDDLYHPQRLAVQMAAVRAFDTAASFLYRQMLWSPKTERLAISRARIWENSMLAARAAVGSYPSLQQGEDTAIVEALMADHAIAVIDAPAHYVRIYHGENVCDAAHFGAHFDHATVSLAGSNYEKMIAQLARAMPMRAYAAGLADA